MLESAKALSKLSHAPRRSIIFLAVTGEEDGLFGSDYFAQNPTVPKGSIVANVNVDMPVIIYPMSTMTVYGIESSTLGPPTTEEVELEGFQIRPDAFPEENYIGRSDQYSFATQGIPFVYLAEGVESSDPDIDGMALATAFEEDHYHQVSDDLSQPLHWESMERFIRVSARVTRRIAMDDERPVWTEGDFFGDTFGP
jgi:Zn-dependent M28 family amino/carboxypeptidase